MWIWPRLDTAQSGIPRRMSVDDNQVTRYHGGAAKIRLRVRCKAPSMALVRPWERRGAAPCRTCCPSSSRARDRAKQAGKLGSKPHQVFPVVFLPRSIASIISKYASRRHAAPRQACVRSRPSRYPHETNSAVGAGESENRMAHPCTVFRLGLEEKNSRNEPRNHLRGVRSLGAFNDLSSISLDAYAATISFE